MKNLGKKLVLHKTTIDILDESALENVRGGAARAAVGSCGLLSIKCKSCIVYPPASIAEGGVS